MSGRVVDLEFVVRRNEEFYFEAGGVKTHSLTHLLCAIFAAQNGGRLPTLHDCIPLPLIPEEKP